MKISVPFITTLISLAMFYCSGNGKQVASDEMIETVEGDIFDESSMESADNEEVSTPCIKLMPEKIEFGGTCIDHTKTLQLEITSCGNALLVINAIYIKDGSSDDFSINHKLSGNNEPTPEKPLILSGDKHYTIDVKFTADMLTSKDENGNPIPDIAYMVIESNSPTPFIEVLISGHGLLCECPQPVIIIEEGDYVLPQTLLHLIGDQSESSSGSIKDYFWSVEQPPLSKSSFMPSFKFSNPNFEANVVGTYQFCLDVCDESGRCSNDAECGATACKEVVVIPYQSIHMELTWDTPNDPNQYDEGPDAGSDLDLHFHHPFATGTDFDNDGKPDGWFDIPYDCYWFNPNPKWGSDDPNIYDDPMLNKDDMDGAGPEIISLGNPENDKIYTIGVHYFDDHGYGKSTACLKIWTDFTLVFTHCTTLHEFDMWEVATINGSDGKVEKVQEASGGEKIIPNYVFPAFNPSYLP